MSIDWMNPSDDVVEAKRIGYEEGLAEAEEQIASLNTGLADHERMLDIVESDLAAEVVAAAELADGRMGLARLVVAAGFARSNSEAMRLVEQGAVRIDDEVQADPRGQVAVTSGAILHVGKRRWSSPVSGPS